MNFLRSIPQRAISNDQPASKTPPAAEGVITG
jgi:hypothetical protein